MDEIVSGSLSLGLNNPKGIEICLPNGEAIALLLGVDGGIDLTNIFVPPDAGHL